MHTSNSTPRRLQGSGRYVRFARPPLPEAVGPRGREDGLLAGLEGRGGVAALGGGRGPVVEGDLEQGQLDQDHDEGLYQQRRVEAGAGVVEDSAGGETIKGNATAAGGATAEGLAKQHRGGIAGPPGAGRPANQRPRRVRCNGSTLRTPSPPSALARFSVPYASSPSKWAGACVTRREMGGAAPEQRSHQHYQRDVQREACARLVPVHGEYLVAVRQYRRHDQEDGRGVAGEGLEPAHLGESVCVDVPAGHSRRGEPTTGDALGREGDKTRRDRRRRRGSGRGRVGPGWRCRGRLPGGGAGEAGAENRQAL